jgi:hypothetical protein
LSRGSAAVPKLLQKYGSYGQDERFGLEAETHVLSDV